MSAAESPAEILERQREAAGLFQRHIDRRRREIATSKKVREKLRRERATVQFLKEKADAQREAATAERFRYDPRIVAAVKRTIASRTTIILRSLGFSSYDEYLASGLWKRIRLRVLDFYEWKCRDCRGPAVQVHHRNYTRENLSGKSLKSLIPVCRRCHCRRHHVPYKPSPAYYSLAEHKD